MMKRILKQVSRGLWRLRHRNGAQQMAALCHRDSGTDPEILLITSSEGRWIIPKGWPIKGKSGAETAAQEAWEEAGVKPAHVQTDAVGWFSAWKRKRNGDDIPCATDVYAIEVAELARSFPEADRRKRRWVKLAKALDLVEDPGLRRVIRQFQRS